MENTECINKMTSNNYAQNLELYACIILDLFYENEHLRTISHRR